MSPTSALEPFKALYQELSALGSLLYYRGLVKMRGAVGANQDIQVQLRNRVGDRVIAPKRKGELHIFVAAPLNNWEKILPGILSPFGKVSVFNWSQGGFYSSRAEWLGARERVSQEMLDAFLSAHSRQKVDVVVGYLSAFNTSPEVLSKFAKMGAILFNFCWDDKLYFSGKVKGQDVGPGELAHLFDLNLTNSPDSCVKYFSKGGLALFWPEAAHPDIHKPYDSKFEFDVSFVGCNYGWRPDFIRRLKRDGINVETFGPGWKNGPLSEEEMIRLYSRTRINLGFAGVGYSKRLQCLKGRDFEIPMSGGLYLTQSNPELRLVYDVGKEIAVYENYSHCLRQIRYLLENPDAASRIRAAGRLRALNCHTWEHRFSHVFSLAGLL